MGEREESPEVADDRDKDGKILDEGVWKGRGEKERQRANEYRLTRV